MTEYESAPEHIANAMTLLRLCMRPISTASLHEPLIVYAVADVEAVHRRLELALQQLKMDERNDGYALDSALGAISDRVYEQVKAELLDDGWRPPR